MYGTWIKSNGDVILVEYCSHEDHISYEEAGKLGWIRTVEGEEYSNYMKRKFLMAYDPEHVTRAALIVAKQRFEDSGKTLMVEDVNSGDSIEFDENHPIHFLNAEIRRRPHEQGTTPSGESQISG